jgi:copper homeostasis protein
MARVLVEIVCSVDDCVAAVNAGADRIELCAAIPLGGLTPPLSLLQEAKARVEVPIMAMCRPRPAGMCYTASEFATMERDIDIFGEHGTEGVVFGVLTEDGRIDVPRCRRLVERAKGLQTVFHRAFEVVPDPFEALEQLIDLGVTRLLTSGQKPNVIDGADLVKELIERAAGRIEILPGAGLTPENVGEFVRRTGCTAVHLAAYEAQTDPSTLHRPDIRYGAGELPDDTSYNLTDREAVARVVANVA